ncbi:MAG: class IV adenylate cyclase [Chloroflexota bacterium]
MSKDINQEIEVKFHVKNIKIIKQRLNQSGARITKPRIFEINYRYDTAEHWLSNESKVLRVRQDSKKWLTYKEPGEIKDGVRIRQEIEISISDIEKTQLILQALGYHVYQSYEKFRTVYILNHSQIMLDELPFGIFIEIESSDINSLKICANILGLSWKFNIEDSYLGIYKKLCSTLNISDGELTFKNFVGSPEMLQSINIFPAD